MISFELTDEQRELAKVLQIVEGTSEIQRQIVATYLKGGDSLGR